jgi:hypothetical protein
MFVPVLFHPARHFFLGIGPDFYEDLSHTVGDFANLRTFVAYREGTPVGTVGIRIDSAKGLSADELYKAELDELRSAGARHRRAQSIHGRRRSSLAARVSDVAGPSREA